MSKKKARLREESVDRLFRDDFKPAWQIRQEQAARHEQLEQDLALHDRADDAYRETARKSRQRIAAKCSGAIYAN